MLDLFDLIADVAQEMEAVGVEYALTGSIASSYYGRPRASIDADFATRMTVDQAEALRVRVADRFYVSAEGLREACQACGMANLIHCGGTIKIDLSILDPTPYHDALMARRRRVTFPGAARGAIWIVAPEDVILMKPEWRKDSRSRRQFDDALGVIQAGREKLDWSYLRRWASHLGLDEDLQGLGEAAER